MCCHNNLMYQKLNHSDAAVQVLEACAPPYSAFFAATMTRCACACHMDCPNQMGSSGISLHASCMHAPISCCSGICSCQPDPQQFKQSSTLTIARAEARHTSSEIHGWDNISSHRQSQADGGVRGSPKSHKPQRRAAADGAVGGIRRRLRWRQGGAVVAGAEGGRFPAGSAF